MEQEYFGKKFYGSKLNTILLLVLIILMVFALKIMWREKEMYLPELGEEKREILGKTEDLISFSISSGEKVSGAISFNGAIKGGWFFEANIVINILDANKKLLKASNAMATTDWMTAERVDFEGNIDFTGLPIGPAYFEIHNDNASGLPEYNKSIQIPIVIK